METRFKSKSQIIDIVINAISLIISVGIMIYGVAHFGLRESWPELVLNVFYIACIVFMVLYFFKRLDSQRFNYWTSICVGITVLLRDVLFPPTLEDYPVIRLACLTLSVTLMLMLMYFYARKDYKSYTKRNLWTLMIIDMAIAGLYTYVLLTSPANEYTEYMNTEIWIRSTIIYGLVSCFVSEKEEQA